MSRIVYVNGQYVPEDQARISPFDRGFIFGDGAYEVVPVIDGRLVDADRMIQRLSNSLEGLGIAWPMEPDDFLAMHRELIARNRLREGVIYSQITRGVAERDFPFPPMATPSIFAFTKAMDIVNNPRAETGISVKLVDELRWKRRDIKSIALLAQVLSRQQAAVARAAEGWMVEDGLVTEGCSSSAFIVKNGTIITSPLEMDGRPRHPAGNCGQGRNPRRTAPILTGGGTRRRRSLSVGGHFRPVAGGGDRWPRNRQRRTRPPDPAPARTVLRPPARGELRTAPDSCIYENIRRF